MSCPTCSHTLQGLGYGLWHCPRCGTLVNYPANGSVHVPALVTRCREFGEALPEEGGLSRDWHRLGIAESINVPESRKGGA